MTVYGTLRTEGAAASGVVFTSRDDNTYGETIAGSDGLPDKGDWRGIYLSGSGDYEGVGEFDYCRVRYGGNPSTTFDANVYFFNSDSGHFTTTPASTAQWTG